MNFNSKYSVFGNIQICLNWVDYLKGVKLINLEDVYFTFETNFYVAILDEKMNPLLGTFIKPED
jgi:hypothetical protein